MAFNSESRRNMRSIGDFLTVDHARLHYLDRGSGPPVVLLHGNGTRIWDFLSSGIVGDLAGAHRVVAFDRPGFGYSERPSHRRWNPFEQAHLMAHACASIGVDRPVVVGHSWGALVALAWAMQNRTSVSGLVLLSGYYYPLPLQRPRPRGPFGNPVLDDAFRRAMLPVLGPGWVADGIRRVFAPCEVPTEFERGYSIRDTLRPSQLRAMSEEADMLKDVTSQMSPFYPQLAVPVHVIAGSDDGIINTEQHSVRLHEELPNSSLKIVWGCGHMVHHAAPSAVAEAVTLLQPRPARREAARNWLHIGDDAHSEGPPVAA